MSAMADAFLASLSPAMKRPKLAIPERFADFLRWIGRAPTPVVEAIADASEGRAVTSIDEATCHRVFGCTLAALPRRRPSEVAVRAGRRGGKTSRLLAPKALHAALLVVLSSVVAGEEAAAVIVAPQLREARIVLRYIRGICESKTELAAMVINKTGEKIGTSDRIALRRPDGKVVEIIVAAAGGGGQAVRAKTLVFVGLDEAEFFTTGGEASDADVLEAARFGFEDSTDGPQVWMVSTPWVDGEEGALAGAFAKDFGRHTDTLCATAPTKLLRPTWDPSGQLEARERRRDPDRASREIDAVPLVSGSTLFFPSDVLQACVEEYDSPMPFDARFLHMAAGDLAFTTNSSALGIARTEGDVARLVYWEEAIPRKGAPLVVSVVCEGFGLKCLEYGCRDLMVDYHSIEAATEYLEKVRSSDPRAAGVGVSVTKFNPGLDLPAALTRVKVLMSEGKVRLPSHPRLLSQLRSIRGVPMPGGRVRIDVPTIGGAHGDLAIACVMALSRYDATPPITRESAKAFEQAMGLS